MGCTFCIAALTVADASITPILADGMEKRLSTAARDLRRIIDTDGSVMWTATFFGHVSASVTVYKASKRARIQARAHNLSAEEASALEDAMARLLGATIVSRHHAPDSPGWAGPPDSAASDPETPWWKAWLPPRQNEDPGGAKSTWQAPGEPGTYESEKRTD